MHGCIGASEAEDGEDEDKAASAASTDAATSAALVICHAGKYFTNSSKGFIVSTSSPPAYDRRTQTSGESVTRRFYFHFSRELSDMETTCP